MNKKWLRLAVMFLEEHSDVLGCAGSNDWKWPTDWTESERRELVSQMMVQNFNGKLVSQFTENEREEMEHMIVGDYGPSDFWVCSFLAKQLQKGT
jgi:hypothetical protein